MLVASLNQIDKSTLSNKMAENSILKIQPQLIYYLFISPPKSL